MSDLCIWRVGGGVQLLDSAVYYLDTIKIDSTICLMSKKI